MKLSEDAGKKLLHARSHGVCELTPYRAEHASHRISRAHGGMWSPANLLHLSAHVHAWLHAHPLWADAGGWQMLRDRRDPTTVPVWLNNDSLPGPGWYLLLHDGTVMQVNTERPAPTHLPPPPPE